MIKDDINARYWIIDPDGFIIRDDEWQIVKEAGPRMYWMKKIGSDGLPAGKPEKIWRCDIKKVIKNGENKV